MKKLKIFKNLMILFWVLIFLTPMILVIFTETLNIEIIPVINSIIWILTIVAAIVFTVLFIIQKKRIKRLGSEITMQQSTGKRRSSDNNAGVSKKYIKSNAREILSNKYRSVIFKRFPENIFDYEASRNLFENLNNTFDAVYALITVFGNPYDRTEKDENSVKALNINAARDINRHLSVMNDKKIIEDWANCTDEQLIDTFILFDFYSEVINNLDIDNIKRFRDYLATELLKRFEKSGIKNDETEPEESVAAGRKELNETEGIEFVNSLEKVFVMYSTATGEKYPSVDMNGFAWIFSKIEFAEYSQNTNAGFNLRFREMTLDEFRKFVGEWYAYGVYQFRLNPGINDAYAEIQRDNFVPDQNAKMFDYYGSNINQLILRLKQNRSCENENNALAFAQTLWSSICHELYKNVFLVPISYDDEPDDAVDNYIHYTDSARLIVNKIEVQRELGSNLKEGEELKVETDCIISNEKLILGSDGYKYATPESSKGGRMMHLRSINNGVSAYLCGFTDIRDIHRIFGRNLHIALMSYEDIIAHIDSNLSDGMQISGLVINPGANELMLSRENIEFAKKESMGPVKLYTAEQTAEQR